ncbi:MAG TPA: transglycosylase domain-containing protein [Kofleriaceae bacterium]|nr:transglycosylase domain-containing protein [Kofleriaceae bacterium]
MRRPWDRRRRWLRWGLAITATSLLLGVAGAYSFYPRIGAWAIRSKAISRVEARLGRDISVGDIEVSRGGRAVLKDVRISGPADGDRPLVTIDRITIEYDAWASLRGEMKVESVIVDGVHGAARRTLDGADNFSDVLLRLRGDGRTAKPRTLRSGLRPTTVRVTSGDGELRDDASGVVIAVSSLSATADLNGPLELVLGELTATTTVGPAASLARATITADPADLRSSAALRVEGGRASLWPGMSLTGIAGTLREGQERGVVELDFSGGYGGVEGTLWRADGWVDPMGRAGSINMKADRFTFDRIAGVLEGSVVQDYDQTSIDAELEITVAPGRADIAGQFHLSGLTVSHHMLASKPVRDVELSGPFKATYFRKQRRLELANAALTSRGVEYQVSGFAALPRGISEEGVRREKWHVGGHLVIPPLPCQRMLDGLPREMIPYLDGAELRGTFKTDLAVEIDFADLPATRLDGGVGIRGCKVKEMPEASNAKRLQETFTHYVEVEIDKWMMFDIGPENPEFVPLWDVSPFLIKSLMTTEDGRFYKHKGFIVSEFKSALIKDLEAGYFKYGASSITMQMVKNVMLYREKTLARKLQELFLTWYVEQELDKDRILEIYLNAIEYGPALYGIGPAAKTYFGKHPRDLNPVEAAFFSSILPNPKERYKQYCKGELWNRTRAKIGRILDLMHKRGRITQDEWEISKDMPLVFDRRDAIPERECRKLADEAIENARPTNPRKK